MAGIVVAAIEEHFAGLSDPRRREPTYPLLDMVVMTHCAVICGADDFVAIAKFARSKQEWFAKCLDLSQGIPSHDRFNAVIGMLKPAEFEKCLLRGFFRHFRGSALQKPGILSSGSANGPPLFTSPSPQGDCATLGILVEVGRATCEV